MTEVSLRLAALFAAGGLGTLARYGVAMGLRSSDFPWGTLVVNAVGSFLFGLVFEATSQGWSPQLRLVVLTGFMGGFTTFSSFAFETWSLFEQGSFARAGANLALQNVAGFLAVAMGVWIARSWA